LPLGLTRDSREKFIKNIGRWPISKRMEKRCRNPCTLFWSLPRRSSAAVCPSPLTTFTSYGKVAPSRQLEIIGALGRVRELRLRPNFSLWPLNSLKRHRKLVPCYCLPSGVQITAARYGQFLGKGGLEPDGRPPGVASPPRLNELEIGNNFQHLHACRQACGDKAHPIPSIACRRQPDLTS
jgi:hypothetical protein